MLPANCCWCSSSVIFWIAKKKKLTYWRKMDTGMNHKLIYYETSQTSLAFLQQSCLGGFCLQRAVDLERTVLTSYFLFLSIEVLCFFFFFWDCGNCIFITTLTSVLGTATEATRFLFCKAQNQGFLLNSLQYFCSSVNYGARNNFVFCIIFEYTSTSCLKLDIWIIFFQTVSNGFNWCFSYSNEWKTNCTIRAVWQTVLLSCLPEFWNLFFMSCIRRFVLTINFNVFSISKYFCWSLQFCGHMMLWFEDADYNIQSKKSYSNLTTFIIIMLLVCLTAFCSQFVQRITVAQICVTSVLFNSF